MNMVMESWKSWRKKWNDVILTEQKIAWRNARATMSIDHVELHHFQ